MFRTSQGTIRFHDSVACSVGREIIGLWTKTRATSTQRDDEEEICDRLEEALQEEWPAANLKLRPFGSCVTGLGTRESDIDLVLMDPALPGGRWSRSKKNKSPLPSWYDVDVVAAVLRDCTNVLDVEPIHAMVPIVKVTMFCSGSKKVREVDISINNQFSLHNTDLLSTYVKLKPKLLPPLYCAVRAWFKARDLNDSSGKSGLRTFSSYALALLVIAFLQDHQELPNLQNPALISKLPSRQRKRLRDQPGARKATLEDEFPREQAVSWDVTFADPFNKEPDGLRCFEGYGWRVIASARTDFNNLPNLNYYAEEYDTQKFRRQWPTLPRPEEVGMHREGSAKVDATGIGERFVLFIRWLDSQIDSNAIIDISHFYSRGWINNAAEVAEYRRGSRSTACDAKQPIEWQSRALVIADPFIHHRNVMGGMSRGAVYRFTNEVRRAYRFLDEPEQFSLAKLASRRG